MIYDKRCFQEKKVYGFALRPLSKELGGSVNSSPAIMGDGKIAIGSRDKKVYVLELLGSV